MSPSSRSTSKSPAPSVPGLWPVGDLNLAPGFGGGESLAFDLNGEARLDGGCDWGDVLPDGGVTMVGVGVLDE